MTDNVADLVGTAAATGRPGGLTDLAEGTTLRWAEVDTEVHRFAATLRAAGVAPGDRVAVVLPTGLKFVVALFAVARVGAVAVPLAVESPPVELARVLSHCGATVLVGGGPGGLPDDPAPAVLAAPELGGGEPADGERLSAVGGVEDIAVLAYTSGTSGMPRGVMLSHRALLANVAQCAALRPPPVTSTDRVLLALPLFHAYGLGPGLLQVVSAGASAVLMDRFVVAPALDACRTHRITAFVGVPAMYQALAAVPADELADAFASVRLLTSGAAPLPARVLATIRHATGLSVFEGYGLTETGPVLTSSLVGGVAKPGAVGAPVPGVELRIVDSDGRPLQTSEDDPDESVIGLGDDDDPGAGVVAARGANLFSGYWPDGAHGPDPDGWFRTGDVGYLDADGDLHLVDRANDLIIVNGFNVYPHEVERVLGLLDGVVDAAAVGEPDERTGERVRAVVVKRPDAELDADAVIRHCAVHLARFKVPAVVEFVADLPYSATGKLRRAGLREVAG